MITLDQLLDILNRLNTISKAIHTYVCNTIYNYNIYLYITLYHIYNRTSCINVCEYSCTHFKRPEIRSTDYYAIHLATHELGAIYQTHICMYIDNRDI